jgi:DNA-binding MarR family transcriptional regulator
MTEKAEELVSSIVAEVFHLSNLFRRWGEIVANTIGETQSRWQVLSAGSDGDKTVAQIARRLGVTRQNVQRVADELVADKLARWEKNPAHKNSPVVQLTSAGRRKFNELTRAASKFNAQLAEGLSLDDLQSTRMVLTKLRNQTDRDITWPEEYMRNL